jgi:hypothetical protein
LKKIIALITLAIVASILTPAWAEDDGVKYKVTIEVTYDELSPEDAGKIMSEASSRYKGASSVSIKKTKSPSQSSIFWDGSNDIQLPDNSGIVFTPN